MTIQELVQNAENSHQAGVPVDWRALCIQVMQAATQTVAGLEEQLAALQPEDQAEVDDGKSAGVPTKDPNIPSKDNTVVYSATDKEADDGKSDEESE